MGCCGSREQPSKRRRPLSQNIRVYYRFGAIIGQGAFGTVRLGYREGIDGEKSYAIKTISKAKVQEKLYLLQQEFEVLSAMDHPNIIRFYEMYEDQMYIYFVMEHCTGGDLLQRILAAGQFSEERTRWVMKRLFQACAYMHRQGVMHRDLKPENILFVSEKESSDIKIIDFGLSKKLKRGNSNQLERAQSKVGSPLYVAPEVLSGNYDCRCDDWSLGCIMYIMLSGEPPFYSEQLSQLLVKIQTEEVQFPDASWSGVSTQCKKLIRDLLCKDPTLRMTSQEAAYSDWVKRDRKLILNLQGSVCNSGQKSQDTPVNTQNIRALRDYSNAKILKRETLRIFINQLNNTQLERLTEKFKEIDQNNDGFITYAELQTVMERLGLNSTKQEIEELLRKMGNQDQQASHSPTKIRYTEFLAATIDYRKYLNKERLWNLFRYFDLENKNYITDEDIRIVLEKEGRKLSDGQLIGKIYFEDFCRIMSDEVDRNAQVFAHFEQQYASPFKRN